MFTARQRVRRSGHVPQRPDDEPCEQRAHHQVGDRDVEEFAAEERGPAAIAQDPCEEQA